jgi:hypothetical protein
MAGTSTAVGAQVLYYGGGFSVGDTRLTSVEVTPGLGIQAQILREATSVYSIRRAFESGSLDGGYIPSGCDAFAC